MYKYLSVRALFQELAIEQRPKKNYDEMKKIWNNLNSIKKKTLSIRHIFEIPPIILRRHQLSCGFETHQLNFSLKDFLKLGRKCPKKPPYGVPPPAPKTCKKKAQSLSESNQPCPGPCFPKFPPYPKPAGWEGAPGKLVGKSAPPECPPIGDQHCPPKLVHPKAAKKIEKEYDCPEEKAEVEVECEAEDTRTCKPICPPKPIKAEDCDPSSNRPDHCPPCPPCKTKPKSERPDHCPPCPPCKTKPKSERPDHCPPCPPCKTKPKSERPDHCPPCPPCKTKPKSERPDHCPPCPPCKTKPKSGRPDHCPPCPPCKTKPKSKSGRPDHCPPCPPCKTKPKSAKLDSSPKSCKKTESKSERPEHCPPCPPCKTKPKSAKHGKCPPCPPCESEQMSTTKGKDCPPCPPCETSKSASVTQKALKSEGQSSDSQPKKKIKRRCQSLPKMAPSFCVQKKTDGDSDSCPPCPPCESDKTASKASCPPCPPCDEKEEELTKPKSKAKGDSKERPSSCPPSIKLGKEEKSKKVSGKSKSDDLEICPPTPNLMYPEGPKTKGGKGAKVKHSSKHSEDCPPCPPCPGEELDCTKPKSAKKSQMKSQKDCTKPKPTKKSHGDSEDCPPCPPCPGEELDCTKPKLAKKSQKDCTKPKPTKKSHGDSKDCPPCPPCPGEELDCTKPKPGKKSQMKTKHHRQEDEDDCSGESEEKRTKTAKKSKSSYSEGNCDNFCEAIEMDQEPPEPCPADYGEPIKSLNLPQTTTKTYPLQPTPCPTPYLNSSPCKERKPPCPIQFPLKYPQTS